MGDCVDELLGDFAVDEALAPDAEVYSIIDLGPGDPKRFRLVRGTEQLMAGSAMLFLLYQLMAQVQMRMSERTKNHLLIHAGSVVTPARKGVLLPADKGSGKSTLVAGLVRSGFGFLSDEIGVLDPASGRLHPFPRPISLKEGSLPVFPELISPEDGSLYAAPRGYVRASKIRPGSMGGPCDVRFVIVPKYKDGSTTRLTPLSQAETAKELWVNGINIAHFGSRALPVLTELVRRARGYRLVSGDLEEAVNVVNEVTNGSAPRLVGSL
jgi:hypothetical protein